MPNYNHEQHSSHNQHANPFESIRFQQPIEAGKPYTLDTARSFDAVDSQLPTPLIAAISADKKPVDFDTMDINNDRTPDVFLLIDIRDIRINRLLTYEDGQEKRYEYKLYNGQVIEGDAHFVLQGPSSENSQKTGLMGIYPGDTIQVGRSDPKTGHTFAMSDTTSRKHFSLKYTTEQEMVITDNNSTGGTNVATAKQLRPFNPQQRQQRQQYRQQHNNYDNYQQYAPPQQSPRRAPTRAQALLDFITPPQGNERVLRVGEKTANYIINEVDDMRKDGVEDRKIMKKLARQHHPDLAPNDHARERNNQIIQAVGHLLDK